MPGTRQPRSMARARPVLELEWDMAVLTADDRGALGYRVAPCPGTSMDIPETVLLFAAAVLFAAFVFVKAARSRRDAGGNGSVHGLEGDSDGGGDGGGD